MKTNDTQSTKLATTKYIIGFVTSLVLTLLAYSLVQVHLSSDHTKPSDQILLILLSGLAISQLIVQLAFFLHLGQEKKPRLNLLSFTFAAIIIFILVFGSLWIMNNLNYHMIDSPEKTKTYLQSQDGL